MIIYADILFFINAFIAYFCLMCTALVLKNPIKRVRLLIASVLGGMYAFSIFLNLAAYVTIPLKILMCLSLVGLAFGKARLREFLLSACLFTLFNILVGGTVLALSFIDAKTFYSNLAVSYMHISPLVLVVSMLLCYLVIVLLTKIVFKRRHREEIYRVTVSFEDKEYTLFGFSDSGNSLSEPFSALPVCIIKAGKIPSLSAASNKRIIPYASLGGEGLLTGARATITFKDTNGVSFSQPVFLAESVKIFAHTHYDIILNEKLFEAETVFND